MNKKNQNLLILFLVIGFMLATFLGYIDHETESLYHLYTTEGNLVFILILTVITGLILFGLYHLARSVIRMCSKP